MDFPTCPYEMRKSKIQSGTYYTPLISSNDDEEDDDEMEDED